MRLEKAGKTRIKLKVKFEPTPSGPVNRVAKGALLRKGKPPAP